MTQASALKSRQRNAPPAHPAEAYFLAVEQLVDYLLASTHTEADHTAAITMLNELAADNKAYLAQRQAEDEAFWGMIKQVQRARQETMAQARQVQSEVAAFLPIAEGLAAQIRADADVDVSLVRMALLVLQIEQVGAGLGGAEVPAAHRQMYLTLWAYLADRRVQDDVARLVDEGRLQLEAAVMLDVGWVAGVQRFLDAGFVPISSEQQPLPAVTAKTMRDREAEMLRFIFDWAATSRRTQMLRDLGLIELHYDLANEGNTVTRKVIAEQEVLVTVERAKGGAMATLMVDNEIEAGAMVAEAAADTTSAQVQLAVRCIVCGSMVRCADLHATAEGTTKLMRQVDNVTRFYHQMALTLCLHPLIRLLEGGQQWDERVDYGYVNQYPLVGSDATSWRMFEVVVLVCPHTSLPVGAALMFNFNAKHHTSDKIYIHTSLHPASAYVLLGSLDEELLSHVGVEIEGVSDEQVILDFKVWREQWLRSHTSIFATGRERGRQTSPLGD